MSYRATAAVLALTVAVLLAAPSTAAAQDRSWLFDVRAGGYFGDFDDGFLGAGFLAPLSPNFYFNPNVEFVLVDPGDLMTFNADFHYDLPVEGRAMVWLGAGLAAVRFDPAGPRDADTDLGGNFFAGIGSDQGSWIPYLQAKALISDRDEIFVLAAGIRF